ncbi:MAG: indolepyruvate ferredoxin oxidoreductase subunit alpha, partial [Deltaproteobacteria bacterium]|nr:indolepyruvate ferredoxin oxidoreductase subunit alpha [Deltaproteobacteria bacterium]
VFKLGTTWPLPAALLETLLNKTEKILFVEEVQPFVEENVKALAAGLSNNLSKTEFFGKESNHIPMVGELNPDLVVDALVSLFDLEYEAVPASYTLKTGEIVSREVPQREISFCPGCPHRASYFSINKILKLDNRDGFVCGDIGCYSMGMLPGGFFSIQTLHSMGSGTGLASGFGKLSKFGFKQPVLSVCGDSTFFHSGMPPLINAIHNNSVFTMVILDNSGTAMTGFQPHPGLPVDASGRKAPALDIARICTAMGAETRTCDPFDLEKTERHLLELIEKESGVNVLILKQACALSPEIKNNRQFDVSIDATRCAGEECGCNRLCTRVFSCPGLIWDVDTKQAKINDVICTGCGVCASICPENAIMKKEVQS